MVTGNTISVLVIIRAERRTQDSKIQTVNCKTKPFLCPWRDKLRHPPPYKVKIVVTSHAAIWILNTEKETAVTACWRNQPTAGCHWLNIMAVVLT